MLSPLFCTASHIKPAQVSPLGFLHQTAVTSQMAQCHSSPSRRKAISQN